MSAARVEYRLLGPVEVVREGAPVRLGPPKARALLGCLALCAGEVVSTGRLVDALWGERPPAQAGHAVQVYVGGLRNALEPGRLPGSTGGVLRTRAPGYVLDVERERVDAHRFAALVERARAELAADRAEGAVEMLREAVELWRGGLLSDVSAEGFVVPEVARFEELRLVAIEERIAAELSLGRHADVVGELTALVREHPLRERLRWHQMLALHRCGRQADALDTFTDLRGRLADQGLTPGPELGRLQMAILRHDPGLAAPGRSVAPLVPRPEPVEPPPTCEPSPLVRTVTVVHAAVTADRPLDDDLSAVLAALPDGLAACLRATGGVVTHREPGCVTAAFGGGRAHEDDPERGVRAALQVVRELDRRGREIAEAWDVAAPVMRVAVCTGRQPAGDERAGPVQAAMSLAGAAPPGRVLVDATTRALVEDQFSWGARDPSGAWEVIAARRISGKVRGLPGRATALVGRTAEFATSRTVLDSALAGNGGLLWLSGEVGLGKTRLLEELRTHAGQARWLHGNCLSFGESLAYWPVRELLYDWLGVSPHAPELRARARLRTRLSGIQEAGGLDTRIGLSRLLDLRLDGDTARRARELSQDAMARVAADALVAVLTGLAAQRPLIVAVEDLHWADTGSLRLLEAVLAATDRAALALLVTARPERGHASWRLRELARREFPHRITEVTLGPLSDDASATLLSVLVGPEAAAGDVGRRLLAAAEGNPFFLEELVRSQPESEAGIPPTVGQVLGARIAGLSVPAQHLLASAAVLGRRFSVRDVVEMTSAATFPGDALRELLTSGLVVQRSGWEDPEYEFRHALTREAGYRSLLPERRRELHRHAAQVLQRRPGQHTATTSGSLAWHWQQAGEDALAMAEHRRAGHAAVAMHALDAAAHHFSEGIAAARRLGPDVDPTIRNDLLLGLAQVGRLSGAGDPGRMLAEVLDAATATGDVAVQWQARYELGYWLGYVRGKQEEARRSFAQAARLAGQVGDTPGQVAALAKISLLLADELNLVAALAQADHAQRVAADAGDERGLADALDARKLCALYLGELAVFEELLPRLEDVLRRHDELWTLQFVLAEAAVAAGGGARWAEARSRSAAAEEVNRRCGDRVCLPFVLATRGAIARSCGDYGEALQIGRRAVASASGGAWWAPWACTELGATLLELHDLPGAIDVLTPAAEAAMFPAQRVRSLALLAYAHGEAGERARAGGYLRRAEALLATVAAPTGKAYLFGADAVFACAALRLESGEVRAAEKLLHPILEAAERSGWQEPLARGLLLVARCRRAAGDPSSAREYAEKALQVASAAELPGVAWQARAHLAGVTGGERLLGAARRDVVDLAGAIPDADLRTAFAATALGKVDAMACGPG